MRISGWSSDVCSSDLIVGEHTRGGLGRDGAQAGNEIGFAHLTNPVRPELVEGPSFLLTSLNEGRGFDKLSPNGRENAPPLRPYILADRIEQAIGQTGLASVDQGVHHVVIFADHPPDRPAAARPQ